MKTWKREGQTHKEQGKRHQQGFSGKENAARLISPDGLCMKVARKLPMRRGISKRGKRANAHGGIFS